MFRRDLEGSGGIVYSMRPCYIGRMETARVPSRSAILKIAGKATALLVLLQLCWGAAQAAELTPAEVEIRTPVYAPSGSHEFQQGTYGYEISWQGIPAAEATVKVERVGRQYRLVATAKTLSFVDMFYKLRYRAEGLISAEDYTPRKMIIDQRENSRIKNTKVKFLRNGEIHSVLAKKDGDRKELQFRPGNFTLEPFSAAFLARSLDWTPGQEREFDTFDGKFHRLKIF